jgi:hypothetical protein
MYVNNPARDERGREGAWACLLAERRRMIASRDADSLKRFELFTFIKNQVGDAVAVVQGRRVLCDFALFSLAWLESENPSRRRVFRARRARDVDARAHGAVQEGRGGDQRRDGRGGREGLLPGREGGGRGKGRRGAGGGGGVVVSLDFLEKQ